MNIYKYSIYLYISVPAIGGHYGYSYIGSWTMGGFKKIFFKTTYNNKCYYEMSSQAIIDKLTMSISRFYTYEAFHAKSSTVWKKIIFDFLHFLTFFVPMKKLFLINFEMFLITSLKDIEFRFFAHYFFKNVPN